MSAQDVAGPTASHSSPTSLNVSVYLPKPLVRRLRAERERTGLPLNGVLAAAFDRVEEQVLHDHLHRGDTAAPGARSGMPASASWTRGSGGQQVQVRMSPEQKSWLDERVQYHQAASRTALVIAVLELGLPGR